MENLYTLTKTLLRTLLWGGIGLCQSTVLGQMQLVSSSDVLDVYLDIRQPGFGNQSVHYRVINKTSDELKVMLTTWADTKFGKRLTGKKNTDFILKPHANVSGGIMLADVPGMEADNYFYGERANEMQKGDRISHAYVQPSSINLTKQKQRQDQERRDRDAYNQQQREFEEKAAQLDRDQQLQRNETTQRQQKQADEQARQEAARQQAEARRQQAEADRQQREAEAAAQARQAEAERQQFIAQQQAIALAQAQQTHQNTMMQQEANRQQLGQNLSDYSQQLRDQAAQQTNDPSTYNRQNAVQAIRQQTTRISLDDLPDNSRSGESSAFGSMLFNAVSNWADLTDHPIQRVLNNWSIVDNVASIRQHIRSGDLASLVEAIPVSQRVFATQPLLVGNLRTINSAGQRAINLLTDGLESGNYEDMNRQLDNYGRDLADDAVSNLPTIGTMYKAYKETTRSDWWKRVANSSAAQHAKQFGYWLWTGGPFGGELLDIHR